MSFRIFFGYTFSDKYLLYKYFDIAVTIGHFINRKHKRFSDKCIRIISNNGLHEFFKTNRIIFMDSGGFQSFIDGKLRITQREIFELQCKLKPDLATALDVPVDAVERTGGITFDKKRRYLTKNEKNERIEITIENANKFKDLCLKSEEILPFTPLVTVQGYDKESYQYCARELKNLDFDYYAIGSCFRAPKKEVIKRVAWVKEILKNKKLHVFGIGSLILIKELIKNFKINSVDTSSHIVAASYGNTFLNGKQKWGRFVYRIIGKWIKKRGNINKYKLAFFNASQIEKFLFGKPNPFFDQNGPKIPIINSPFTNSY